MGESATRVMVTGQLGGGFRMRGRDIAKINSWAVYPPNRVRSKKWGCIVLVKNDAGIGKNLRGLCDKLIYDPLDVWMGDDHHDICPAKFWSDKYKQLRFTDSIATSPACASVMDGNPNYRVHMFPHHADPSCTPDWYDSEGHITYAGDMRYLGGEESKINQACESLGVRFRVTGVVSGLAGSRAVLALRLGKWSSPLNATCKPQVKIENAFACRMPVLATPHACTVSLYAKRVLVTEVKVRSWEEEIQKLLQAKRPSGEFFSQKDYARRLKNITSAISTRGK